MRKRHWFVVSFALLNCLSPMACAICNSERAALSLPETANPTDGLVLVCDGAGDFRATSQALRDEIHSEKLPLRVQTFVWSHGYLRVFADQLDQGHAYREGERLADTIMTLRRQFPRRPLCVVAHSAGSAVALAAASDLPPHTIDRILLFAPSVPADYDLRPALRSVSQEIDVFSSSADRAYLRASDFITSIACCRFCAAAGCAGFRPILQTPEDAALYRKLRDFPWEPRLIWTGHDGGHFGYYQRGYLRNFVLPLLSGAHPS